MASPMSISAVKDYTKSDQVLTSIAMRGPAELKNLHRPNRGSWQSQTILLGSYKEQEEAKIMQKAEKMY